MATPRHNPAHTAHNIPAPSLAHHHLHQSQSMTPYHEKVFFGLTTLASTGASMLGAIITTGEARWIYVTLASSMMTSGFLALMFKRSEETMRLVIGRCGFAVLGGILATRPIVHHLGFDAMADTDIISLGGLSSATCIATFFVGYAILSCIERSAPSIAEKWFKKFTE